MTIWCWSLSQVQTDGGRIHPWMIGQIIIRPYFSIWGLGPCPRVSRQQKINSRPLPQRWPQEVNHEVIWEDRPTATTSPLLVWTAIRSPEGLTKPCPTWSIQTWFSRLQTTPPQWWSHLGQWWDPLKRGDRTPDMNGVQTTTFSWNQQHRGGHCGSQEVVGDSCRVYEHQLLGAGVTSILTWFAVNVEEGKSFWLYSKMLLAVLQHRILTPQKSKVKSWTVNLDCSSPFYKHDSTINAWMTTEKQPLQNLWALFILTTAIN